MRRPLFSIVLYTIAIAGMAGCGGSGSGSGSDFTIAVSPTSANLSVGVSGQVTVSATATGSGTPIAVTISGLPAGVTASPASFTLTSGTPQTVSLSALYATATTQTVTVTGTAGGQTHTATFSLTANVPPADFTLSANPSAATLTIGGAPVNIAFTANATGSLNSTIGLSFSDLPSGVSASPATLSLIPGQAQQVAFGAAATAAPATATIMADGIYNSVRHSIPVTLTVAAQTAATADVTTYHFDNARDGLNAQETVLTPANVASASFGKLGFFPGDGKVDAQPLYLAGLAVNGTATNVLYMATEHGSVYAMNADTGAQIWKTSVLGTAETTSDDHGCSQITPEIGITSTPVIDRAAGIIFVVGMSKDSAGAYHQRLHALNLTTGAELGGSPVEITGTYPGSGANSANGTVVFAPGQYAERAGLLLLNGTIYLAWTSHCDYQPYTGWVMAYSESALQQTAILNLTPNGSEGAVWMSGSGMPADAGGNIYFLDANGTLDPTFDSNGFPAQQDYGNAIIKLSTTGGKLAVADYFEPYNSVAESNSDIDMGSGGAMLLPDLTDASGSIRHLMIGAGKDRNIYIGDRDNLGKFNQKTADNSNLYQELPNALASGAWSSPAYFNGTVYYAGQNDVLKAFPITNASVAAAPSSQSSVVFPYPGSTPSVSSNGTQNAIVWALESNTGQPNVLHAYDATNLSKELYNSSQAAGGRDAFGNGNKFITPVIVNGKVFVGTQTGVAEFGLLP